jgi:hypothetical protein
MKNLLIQLNQRPIAVYPIYIKITGSVTSGLLLDPAFDLEWGHINIKQKEEWIALFYSHGFDYLQDAKDVCSWGMIFKKKLYE